MDFQILHAMVPYQTGPNHTVELNPYPGITLALPGRHQNDTCPVGGDFVVMVTDDNMGWTKHQFTHSDLWDDIEIKHVKDPANAKLLMQQYAAVVRGVDPDSFLWASSPWENTLAPKTFLYAVQCLAVAEHRRYHQFEKDGGGRYLPARFSAGIIEGKWTADDAKKYQYRGRQGLENLIKEKGRPQPLKALAGI